MGFDEMINNVADGYGVFRRSWETGFIDVSGGSQSLVGVSLCFWLFLGGCQPSGRLGERQRIASLFALAG
jgi:hypothetical protein